MKLGILTIILLFSIISCTNKDEITSKPKGFLRETGSLYCNDYNKILIENIKKSDLRNERKNNLKGKVKEIRNSIKCPILEKEDSLIWKTPRSNISEKYNQMGNIIEWNTKYQSVKYQYNKFNRILEKVFFDENDIWTKTISYKYKDGCLIETLETTSKGTSPLVQYFYPNKNEVRTLNYFNNREYGYSDYKYNNAYEIVEKIDSFYRAKKVVANYEYLPQKESITKKIINKGKVSHYRSNYIFNKNGDIVSYNTKLDKNDNDAFSTNTKIKYDKNGNWVEKIKYSSRGNINGEKRNIEYY